MFGWLRVQVSLSVDIPGLGDRIRRVRLAKGLTATEAGALANMSTANWYRIENEEVKSLPRTTLKKLSQALEFDFDAELRAVLRAEVS